MSLARRPRFLRVRAYREALRHVNDQLAQWVECGDVFLAKGLLEQAPWTGDMLEQGKAHKEALEGYIAGESEQPPDWQLQVGEWMHQSFVTLQLLSREERQAASGRGRDHEGLLTYLVRTNSTRELRRKEQTYLEQMRRQYSQDE
jgi:hypothetical protein